MHHNTAVNRIAENSNAGSSCNKCQINGFLLNLRAVRSTTVTERSHRPLEIASFKSVHSPMAVNSGPVRIFPLMDKVQKRTGLAQIGIIRTSIATTARKTARDRNEEKVRNPKSACFRKKSCSNVCILVSIKCYCSTSLIASNTGICVEAMVWSEIVKTLISPDGMNPALK